MIALMTSQFRQLLPFAMLWTLLLGLAYGFELATTRVDEQHFLNWCSSACSAGANLDQLLFLLFFCMLAAYSLFPREFDDGSIDFIRSLPVSRSKIFIAKVLACWLLICALLALESLLTTLLVQFNTQTLSGRQYPAIALPLLLRSCLFALVVIAHGVFISWFRVTGLVLYCGYLIGLYWLEEVRGVSGVFSLFRFFDNEYAGQRILFDWQAISAQVLVALILLVLSYTLWNRRESQARPRQPGLLAKYAPAVLSAGLFLLLSAALAVYLNIQDQSRRSDNIKRATTEHYRFSYHRADQARMLELQRHADPDYQALVELIGVQKQPFIHARMTLESNHAHGYAAHKQIRMKLGLSSASDPLSRRVLSHETTHVLQGIESNGGFSEHRNSVGFFLEGMAQYTSFQVVPDPTRRETNWAISSVAWQRQMIRFEQLTNRATFDTRHDPELIYGIGDIWVDAMVRHCGERALGDLLRSAARSDAPGNLNGSRYWRYHLQHIGCELEQVNFLWRQQMQTIIDNRTDGAFPEFSQLSSTIREDQLVIRATVTPDRTGALPARYFIRLASETKVANKPDRIRSGKVIASNDAIIVEFSLPLQDISGSRYRYQLGFLPYANSRYYFDTWRSAALAD